MSNDANKQAAAQAALKYVEEGMVLGVGTGSTVNMFIDLLKTLPFEIEGAVATSRGTAERLKAQGIRVLDPNAAGDLRVYVDGADEANKHGYLIKGGGGALTAEKIIASVSRQFICIIDESKWVDVLGAFPLPIEVLPMARSAVARQIVRLGGDPALREGFETEHGNVILDVYNFKILNPVEMEATLNQIPGVVCNGIFAKRHADVMLVAGAAGVKTMKPE
jgi:ribose 5-phosphate isomerase A